MSRNRNMRFARHTHSHDTPRDEFGRFRNDDHHRWDVSPSYREQIERGDWDNDHRYRESDYSSPTRYQYFGGREEYPGPGRMQGFGPDYDYNDRRHDQRLRENHQGGKYQDYRNDVRNMSEYGYGSGRAEMPAGRTWDRREDESYDWGEHKGEKSSHRGKGPKGYKRLDERIREDINDQLTDDHRLDASDIVVTVQDGEVTLTGTVFDRASKRRAEDIVEGISGVQHVENRVRVGKVTPKEPISRDSQNREIPNGKSKVLQER